MENRTRVIFFQVKDTTAKLNKVCQTAAAHFEKKEPLLILAPNLAAVEFIDSLLWRLPEESFLPHALAESQTEEVITIASTAQNLNQATRLFNLTPDAVFFDDPFKVIYELDDHSTSEKKHLSEQRFAAYRKAGYLISSL